MAVKKTAGMVIGVQNGIHGVVIGDYKKMMEGIDAGLELASIIMNPTGAAFAIGVEGLLDEELVG